MTEKTAILTVRTNAHIKKAAQKAAKELGVPLSAIVNASLRAFVEHPRLELEPLIPNARTARLLDAIRKEPRGKVFTSSEALFAELDS